MLTFFFHLPLLRILLLTCDTGILDTTFTCPLQVTSYSTSQEDLLESISHHTLRARIANRLSLVQNPPSPSLL